jgi:hypothetical protein
MVSRLAQPMSDQKPPNPEAERAIAKVRRMMMIVMAATFFAVALVFGVIGYRLFYVEESESAAEFVDVTQALPAGAKVLSTAVGADHIVVTIEVGGVTEVLTFDPDTLKPLGRLRFAPKP